MGEGQGMICSRCKIERPETDFKIVNCKGRASYRSGICVHCKREKDAAFQRKKRQTVEKKEWDKEYRERNKERIKAQQNKRHPPSRRIYVKTCKQTGELFIARRKNTEYSKEGYEIKCRIDGMEYGYKKYGTLRFRICKICGNEYDKTRQGTYGCCSEQCRKEYYKIKRREIHRLIGKNNHSRARHYGVPHKYFNVTKVLERDHYTCQLCGIKTPKRLRGIYKDNAPELDHIIPLSQGGSHTIDNVQCACRKCNMKKGNKIYGQLRIAV